MPTKKIEVRLEVKAKGRDPVHKDKGSWWFWDEAWAYRYGPYPSEKKARRELENYCKDLLG